MAITKINWKETGKKFSEVMNKIKTSTKTTATAIALALWTASCDWHPMTVSVFSGAQWDYESGASERAVTAQEQQVNAKKEAFNAYLDQYNDLQKKLVDDNSRGDKQAAKQIKAWLNSLECLLILNKKSMRKKQNSQTWENTILEESKNTTKNIQLKLRILDNTRNITRFS